MLNSSAAFHTRDAAALAGFWSRFLELPVDDGANPAYATIGFHTHGPTWMFHWPTGSSDEGPDELPAGPNRFMLDFAADEQWRNEADRVVEFGATRVGDREYVGAQWAELTDPDGNTFRIFGPRPE